MRVPTDQLVPTAGTQPDETSMMMAQAIEHQRQYDPIQFGDRPIEPTSSKVMKDFVEKKRTEEDDPNVTKYPARTVIPGERAIDRERGAGSERKIRRL